VRSEYLMADNVEKNSGELSKPDSTEMAWLLFVGGLVGSLYLLIKKSRSIVSWIMAVGIMVAGFALVLQDRRERIQQTGDQIIAQLDKLDPIARAQVVKYVADQEFGRVT
jgi:hypothetical protein